MSAWSIAIRITSHRNIASIKSGSLLVTMEEADKEQRHNEVAALLISPDKVVARAASRNPLALLDVIYDAMFPQTDWI